MDNRFSISDRELYKRVDEVLFYIWDPINVSKETETRDEYNSYVGVVFSKLKQDKGPKEIATYLDNVASDKMGLKSNDDSKKNDLDVADLLVRHKNFVSANFLAAD